MSLIRILLFRSVAERSPTQRSICDSCEGMVGGRMGGFVTEMGVVGGRMGGFVTQMGVKTTK